MKRIIIPDTWMGESIEGAMNEALAIQEDGPKGEKKNKPKGKSKSSERTSTDINDLENWVLLEGRQRGSYTYPDLFVCMHRLGYDADVGKTAKDLGFNVSNTGEEKDKTPYIGNINWEQALRLNCALGNLTLTPRQGLDLMLDLRTGINEKKKIYDGKGNVIDKERLKIVYSEIWGKRDPWRSEWSDACFEEDGGEIYIKYGHFLDGSKNLVHGARDKSGNYLKSNGFGDVRSANSYGLITKPAEAKKLQIYFYYPVDGAVAEFVACSDGVDLFCYGGPAGADPALGVRACREKK